MTWLLVKYILTAAMRDRILLGFLVLVGIGISLSIFLGSSAITEKDQFSVVFAAGGLRIAGLLTLILFTIFYLRKSFDTRDVEYLLSRPISRFQFLLAHSLAFSILATVVASGVLFAVMAMPLAGSAGSYMLWGLSIWVEFIIMVNISLFFALVLSSAVTATLITIAFYVLARLMGDILGIIEAGENIVLIAFMEKAMLFISVFIPRLDLMGQTAWLVYGAQGYVDWVFIILQGIIFCGVVLSAALLDLNRKQF